MGRDDAVDPAEVNIGKCVKLSTSLLPGVREHGMLDIGNRRQPSKPIRSQQNQSKSDK